MSNMPPSWCRKKASICPSFLKQTINYISLKRKFFTIFNKLKKVASNPTSCPTVKYEFLSSSPEISYLYLDWYHNGWWIMTSLPSSIVCRPPLFQNKLWDAKKKCIAHKYFLNYLVIIIILLFSEPKNLQFLFLHNFVYVHYITLFNDFEMLISS